MKHWTTYLGFGIIAALLIPLIAVAGDYPLFRGNNQRQGNPTNVLEDAASAYLSWYFPKFIDTGRTLTKDDNVSYTLPYDPTPGYVATDYFLGPMAFGWTRLNGTVISDADKMATSRVGDTYYYTEAVQGDKPADATTSLTWTLHVSKSRRYKLEVFIPGEGTKHDGTNLSGHTTSAYYRVDYGDNQHIIIKVDQDYKNRWAALGDNFSFPTRADNTINVTLYNYSDDFEDENGDKNIILADAIRAIPARGSVYASPAVADVDGDTLMEIFVARNEEIEDPMELTWLDENYAQTSYSDPDGQWIHTGLKTMSSGVIYCLNNKGDVRWRFPLSMVQTTTTIVDNNQTSGAASFTADPTTWLPAGLPDIDLTQTNPYGVDFSWAKNTVLPAEIREARWTVTTAQDSSLVYGRYNIYAWIPKDVNNKFSTSVEYSIRTSEGTDTVTINQNNPTYTNLGGVLGGWVQLGKKSYLLQDEIRVTIDNEGADPSRYVVADSIAFVGRNPSEIYSSPAVGVVNGRSAVIVASSDHHVYSLDANGNPTKGTTWPNWTYPSAVMPKDDLNIGDGTHYYESSSSDNYRDRDAPTLGPWGYSSPVIADNKVFIANTNGRIYALDAVGLADGYDQTKGIPGRTIREWAYPNILLRKSDGVIVNQDPSVTSGFVGSPAVDGSVVYIGGMDGRLYALGIDGDGQTKSDLKWVYPKLPSATEPGEVGLGYITSTPAVSSDTVYLTVNNSSGKGELHAVNKSTGEVRWVWSGFGAKQSPGSFTYSSPLLMTVKQSGTDVPVVIAASTNGRLYWIRAFTSSDPGGVWLDESESFNGQFHSSPVAVTLTPQDNSGRTTASAVVIGTRSGDLVGTYADIGLYNTALPINTYKMLWGKKLTESSAGVFASFAAAGNALYVTSEDGLLYAFSSLGIGSGSNTFHDDHFTNQEQPAEDNKPQDVQNDNADFKNAEVTFISEEGYRLLQKGTIDPDEAKSSYADSRNSQTIPAFEWGDRIYMLLSDFSYQRPDVVAPDGSRGKQPVIQFQMWNKDSTVTKQATTVTVVDKTLPMPVNPPYSQEAYALVVFDFVWLPSTGLSSWITPGDTFQMGASAQGITLPWSKIYDKQYRLANPIAIAPLPAGQGSNADLGNDLTNNGIVKAAVNGNGYLALNLPAIPHGQNGWSAFSVADRSYMGMNPSSGKNSRNGVSGLDNIRASQSDIAFMGGKNAVYKPIWGTLTEPFEIPPGLNLGDNLNNNSSPDYPDLDLRQVEVIHELSNINIGIAAGVGDRSSSGGALRPPMNITNSPDDYSTWKDRTLVWDDIRTLVDVPRFQPPSQNGYAGKIYIYQDLNGDREFTGGPGSMLKMPPPKNVEPYREVSPNLFIPPDERVAIESELVDLGSMPHGALIDNGLPIDDTNRAYPAFISPSSGGQLANNSWQFFKPFTVRNRGNVNLLNLRVVRRYFDAAGNRYPVGFLSDTVSRPDWMSGELMLVSNLDTRFDNWGLQYKNGMVLDNAPLRISGFNGPTLHKARAGDSSATTMTIPDVPYNVRPYANSETKISVGIPVGQPVGTYSQVIQVVEQSNGAADGSVSYNASGSPTDAVSNPSMRLMVRVRESRITNGYTDPSVGQLDARQELVTASGTIGKPFMSSNVLPCGWRSPGGAVNLIFTSNRTASAVPTNTIAPTNQWWMPAAQLTNIMNNAPTNIPLGNLYSFQYGANVNSENYWWRMRTGSVWPSSFPTTNTVYGNIIPNGASYGSPAISIPRGDEPNLNVYNDPWVYFIGQAQKADNAGQIRTENLLLYQRASQWGSANPIVLNSVSSSGQLYPPDPTMAKYRPIPLDLSAISPSLTALFWSGATSGVSRLYATIGTPDNSNSWVAPITVNTTSGLSSVLNPVPVFRNGATGPYVDLYYEGITRDQSHSDIYMSRYPLLTNRLGNSIPLQEVYREEMRRDGEQPVWRSKHIDWEMGSGATMPPVIEIKTRATATNPAQYHVIVNSSDWTYDYNGMAWADTVIGGRVVADTRLGTIRFTGAVPFATDTVLITYAPKAKRITTTTTGGSSKPIGFLDRRAANDNTLVFDRNGQFYNMARPNDRLWLFYNRSGAARSQNTSLYFKTNRYGVKLSHPVNVLYDAATRKIRPSYLFVNMAGLDWYQVDPGISGNQPAAGKIFFAETQETLNNPNANTVTITYDTADGNGRVTEVFDGTSMPRPDWIEESPERLVPIEQVVNESNLSVFPDLSPSSDLIWLFWNSSRTGTDDLYYMTMAPQFTVFPK